jgi:transcriptional regulator with XRE-family HTH domain
MSILSNYLKETGLLQAEFAAKVGVGQGTISRLANGTMNPGLPLAIKIERATGGSVPVESWLEKPSNSAGVRREAS